MIEKLGLRVIDFNEKRFQAKINEIIDTLSKPSVPSVEEILKKVNYYNPCPNPEWLEGWNLRNNHIVEYVHNLLTGGK